MKPILIAIVLLTVIESFAGTDSKSANASTNTVTFTNVNGVVKHQKVSEKADAYTGATRKNKKQK